MCAFSYELRLHRARGYGALKAILEILSEEEPLTLTEIAQRLGRTPGSTKDYLSWLEDVDLVAVQQKRYRFRDPLLRVWVEAALPPDAAHAGGDRPRGAALRRRLRGAAGAAAAPRLAYPSDSLSIALRAASCSAAFLLGPRAAPITSPRTRTSTWKILRWSGPLSAATEYSGSGSSRACTSSCSADL